MTLSRADVDHVATLARLGLSDVEKDRLLGELEAILGHLFGRIERASHRGGFPVVLLSSSPGRTPLLPWSSSSLGATHGHDDVDRRGPSVNLNRRQFLGGEADSLAPG